MGQLTSWLQVRPPTLTDAVRALERKELVVRHPAAHDRRVRQVVLTEEGEKVADRFQQWHSVFMEQLPASDDEERAQVYSWLLHFIDRLQHAGYINEVRMCLACKFYRSEEHPYCSLLKRPLRSVDLRIDCPEYEAIEY